MNRVPAHNPFGSPAADPAAFYRNRKVLITGGLGFIGSNLAIRLAGAGARVTVIDCLDPGCGGNPFNLAPVESLVNVIEADIADAAAFAQELCHTDVIFNLAGEISHSRSMREPERDLALNTAAQLRFVLACRDHRPGARVVFAATRQVYGRPEYLPVDEAHSIRPVDFNGIHKHAAAQYHLLLADNGELDAVVLRLSNVYGPRMALHLPQQGFLGVYLRRALEQEPLCVYGDGLQLRDPVHVDDVVDAFLRAGAAPRIRSRVFNIGGAQPLSLRDIAATFSRFCPPRDVMRVPFPRQMLGVDIGSYCSDTARAGEELNWVASVPFEEGLRETLGWFRLHAHHYLPVRALPAAAL